MMWCFQVNVVGTLRVTQALLPLLEKGMAGSGGLCVNVSSDLGSLTNNCPNNAIGQPHGGKTSYRPAGPSSFPLL